MQTIVQTQQQPAITYSGKTERKGVIARLLDWSEDQEKSRFGWLAFILASHGCVLTPLTLFAVILSGASLTMFIATIVAMGLALVTNLAAMPTRITIPVFFFSVLIDIAVVIACVISGFNVAAAGV